MVEKIGFKSKKRSGGFCQVHKLGVASQDVTVSERIEPMALVPMVLLVGPNTPKFSRENLA